MVLSGLFRHETGAGRRDVRVARVRKNDSILIANADANLVGAALNA